MIDSTSEQKIRVRSNYVIGADGAHSRVREILGIKMVGSAIPGSVTNILFKADLSAWVEGRSINICFIGNPKARSVLAKLPRPNLGTLFPRQSVLRRWNWKLFAPLPGVPPRGTRSAMVKNAFSSPRRGTRNAGSWRLRYEHRHSGCAQLDTWKLGAVIKGFAGSTLLESYSEREPIGKWVVEQTLRNFLSVRAAGQSSGAGTGATAAAPPSPRGRSEFFKELGLIFGAVYHTGAIIPDGSPEPQLSNPVTDYKPTARPGHRAPHVWFRMGGQRVSTTDLLGPFVLQLAGGKGELWYAAAKKIAMSFRFLRAHIVRRGDLVPDESSWREAFGIEPDGAVLIHPDGYVLWRSRTPVGDPREELSDVLNRVLRINK